MRDAAATEALRGRANCLARRKARVRDARMDAATRAASTKDEAVACFLAFSDMVVPWPMKVEIIRERAPVIARPGPDFSETRDSAAAAGSPEAATSSRTARPAL